MEKSIDSPNEAEIKGILGIDFGKAKIGLALADSETRMAFAFDTLPNDKDFFNKLRNIIQDRDVKEIVVGITKHENDLKSAQEKDEFVKMIEKETGIVPALQDEMFTTKMAQANIKQRGGRNIAGKDDQEAARIILQEWLDKTAS